MNPREPRSAQSATDEQGHRIDRQRHDHRRGTVAAERASAPSAPSSPVVSAEETDWIERSARVLPQSGDISSFTTGLLPTLKLPIRRVPDISEQPTMVLPALGKRAATTQPDVSEWPTRPSLPNAQSMPELTVPDEVEDFDSLPTWVLPVVTAEHRAIGARGHRPVVVAGAQGYLTLVGSLFRSSAVYALASLGAPLITLGLSPFLAHYLSKSDYGILTIMTTVIGLAAGITQLGLGSAFFRAYNFDYSTQRDRYRVLSTTVILLALASILAASAVSVAAPFLANLLFNRPALGQLVTLAAGVVVLQNLTIPGFSWLRAESRAGLYSGLSIANTAFALVANIVLVGIVRWGVAGALIATGIGYASAVIVMMPIVVVRAGIRFQATIAKELLAFGLPLVLNFVSYWVLQLSDRYLLAVFRSLSETATYSVAYTLGSAINVVVITPFTLAWPTTMYMIAKRGDATQIFRLVFRWLSMLLMFTAFALSLAGQFILTWLFPAAYHSAAPIIPVVAGSLVFYGIYFVLMAGANIRRKTWLAAVFTSASAVVNFGLNLMLIPKYGQMGAAISTLVAYIVLAVLAYVANQRIYPVPYEVIRFMCALAGGAAIFAWSSSLVGVVGAQWTWQINIVGLAVYGGWLLLLGMSGRASRRPQAARVGHHH